ncbi:MAG TPA: DinB family protein, partial [Vicinamibacterales bacterium]|nr:DinB family protein [Vicinamibacterales bacterium]
MTTDVSSVIEALARAPRIVVPLVREMPASMLKRRPAPGKWSAHEHACHLAVVHRLFLDRLDYMLATPAPVITPYDPGRDDPDDALLSLDLEESLQRYADDRARLVSRLRELSDA